MLVIDILDFLASNSPPSVKSKGPALTAKVFQNVKASLALGRGGINKALCAPHTPGLDSAARVPILCSNISIAEYCKIPVSNSALEGVTDLCSGDDYCQQ